jgi:hypothetical protein
LKDLAQCCYREIAQRKFVLPQSGGNSSNLRAKQLIQTEWLVLLIVR